MHKVSTPNLDHLVKTRGDIHDLRELRALKGVARAVGRIGTQWPGTIPEAWRPYLHLVRLPKGAK